MTSPTTVAPSEWLNTPEVAIAEPVRPTLVSRTLVLVFVASFGAMASFYLLLSVVPQYAASVGAGGMGAGFSTGALMLSTVIAELATPKLVTRFGHRNVLAAGLVLLGAPALVLPSATSMSAILAICVVRGIGVAITVVIGGALVPSLVPSDRRGEGLGLYGVVVGIPAVIGLPLGVWLAGHAGYVPVFAAGAASALVALAAVPGLPGVSSTENEVLSLRTALRTRSLVRPSIVFSATTMAAGVIVTFLPLAVHHESGNVAAVALLVQAGASTIARWWAGRYGDRHGSARLLVPAVLVAASGMAVLALTESVLAVVAGVVLFGVGFGIAQNASLTMMFERVDGSGYDTVSALWNIAYDAGLGVGAAGFGVAAAQAGYPTAFVLVAAMMIVAVIPQRMSEKRT